jgi:hypothetical protein
MNTTQSNRNKAAAGANQAIRVVPTWSTPRTGDFCLSQTFHSVDTGGLTDTTEELENDFLRHMGFNCPRHFGTTVGGG